MGCALPATWWWPGRWRRNGAGRGGRDRLRRRDPGRCVRTYVGAGCLGGGDCARFVLGGEPARLESVQNAIDQAEAVADDMLGQGRPYQPVPWFWSDQYDMKLQIVGLNRGYDAVVSHASAKGESHWYFRADRLISVDALNDGRAYMVGKKLLEAGRAVGRGEVERPGFEPMQLLRDQAEGRLR